jgi:hypothetical protein
MNYGYCCRGPGYEFAGVPEPLQGWDVSYVVVPPPVEPLTLDEVKLYHRIDQDLEDSEITRLIKSARQYVEEWLGSSLVTQTREINARFYTTGMHLPFGPVQSIESATPIEGASTAQLVRYVCGFPPVDPLADPIDYIGNIPEPIKTAMQLLIGELYENREVTVIGTLAPSPLPFALEAQLEFYRLRRGFA